MESSHLDKYTFLALQNITTAELYSLVIDKSGAKRWKFRGRKDDLLKLSWLAKFHASYIENDICRDPRISALLVGGEGRDVLQPLSNFNVVYCHHREHKLLIF